MNKVKLWSVNHFCQILLCKDIPFSSFKVDFDVHIGENVYV